MKLTLTTCMHQRAAVTRLFLMRFVKLKEYCSTIGIDLSMASAVTKGDKESAALCDEFGVRYIPFENKPLGAKWNAAINLALSLGVNGEQHYIVITGDDDLISEKYFDLLKSRVGHWSMNFGVWTAYVLEKKRCGMFKHKERRPIGSGTCLNAHELKDACLYKPFEWHRPAKGSEFDGKPFLYWELANHLEALHYGKISGSPVVRIFPDQINSALDFNRDIILADRGILIETIETEEPLIVCIKSGKNIWDLQSMYMHSQAKEANFETAFSMLDKEEQEYYTKNFVW